MIIVSFLYLRHPTTAARLYGKRIIDKSNWIRESSDHLIQILILIPTYWIVETYVGKYWIVEYVCRVHWTQHATRARLVLNKSINRPSLPRSSFCVEGHEILWVLLWGIITDGHHCRLKSFGLKFSWEIAWYRKRVIVVYSSIHIESKICWIRAVSIQNKVMCYN